MNSKLFQRRVGGFSLVELLVIIAVLAVLIALILPEIARPRVRKSTRIKCINNLKNVGLAFRIFATDNEDQFPMRISTNEGGSMEFAVQAAAFRHFAALSNELSTPKILVCPMDKKRKPATNFFLMTDATISYFVGLDATAKQPQTFLAGDRNLSTNGRPVKAGLVELTTNTVAGWTSALHSNQGNVAMGDGSVQQFSTPKLAQALHGTGWATNRLVVP